MAGWKKLEWQPQYSSGLPKKQLRSGEYYAYLPDEIANAPLSISSDLGLKLADAETKIAGLNKHWKDLVPISRFLLRSEAIASSLIEGIAPTGRQVAMAELSKDEDDATASQQAKLVANNMTVLEQARTTMVNARRVRVDHIVDMQRALLADESAKQGIRKVQNWVGGSSFGPLEAQFVPPPPEMVEGYLNDLVDYMNAASHSPLVQAALVHAQFETIHPFIDGNGRVGRALIHVVLARRGLTSGAILPVSMVLATFSERYVEGLTKYRHDSSIGDKEFHEAREFWINIFVDAVISSCDQAEELAHEIAELRSSWAKKIAAYRKTRGINRNLRRNSATAVIMDNLPATPILSSLTAERIHGLSHVSAKSALDELSDAGILKTSKSKRRTYYRSDEVLNTLTYAERSLASTKFDTRVSPPNHAVPARPID